MAWFKVDDQLAFHAKTVMAGNSAMGLWVRAGSWASAQLTGGFVPSAIANAMASANGKDMANESDCAALVRVGLWHEVEGGYQFHEWEGWQPDAAEERRRRDEIREKRKAAGQKGAAARWGSKGNGKRMANAMTDGKANEMANECDPAWQNDGTAMAPSPSPSLTTEANASVGGPGDPSAPPKTSRRKPAKPIPADWSPTEAHQAKANELGLDVHIVADAFVNHWIANDGRKADWDAAFRAWMANEVKYRQERAQRPSGPPRGQAKQEQNIANLAAWAQSKRSQQEQSALPFPGGDPA